MSKIQKNFVILIFLSSQLNAQHVPMETEVKQEASNFINRYLENQDNPS